MPELPEVETIKLSLQPKIVGLSIKSLKIFNKNSIQGNPKLVIDKNILNIERKAKLLLVNLDGDISILFHLKMSGQLIFAGDEKFIGGHPTIDMLGALPNKSTRVIFEFSNNSKLYFNDQRKFGWIKIFNKEQLSVDSFLNKLGPEPLEKKFTWRVLKMNLLKHKASPVKVALLDQSIIAGVGNIYASEACFNAKIDPRTKVRDLTDEQFRKLHSGLVLSLQRGIKYGGSTRTHFVDVDGKKGLFLDYAKVYNRDKKLCLVCQTPIEKIKLGGRGTFFCPHCQN
jgi:formamidopyrimidine-DNA glycosylase